MLKIQENMLDIDTYMNLRAAVGWKVLKEEQALLALKNSIFTVTASIDDKVVGMGRMVGDGAVICYIQDLVVHPSYQKLGVGQDREAAPEQQSCPPSKSSKSLPPPAPAEAAATPGPDHRLPD